MTETAAPELDPADRKRSPAYPTIDLGAAIEKARKLYTEDKGSPASPEVIAGHWKSKTSSSAFMQWLASLKRFNLLVEVGKPGSSRQWKVSPQAVDIFLLPDEDPKRVQRVKELALAPKPHQELWAEYGVTLPSDAKLLHQLVTTRGFKPNSAKELITQYRKTLAFAGLTEADKVVEQRQDPAPNGDSPPAFGVGDFVQWESAGALRLPHPKRLTGFSPDGAWAFVDGSKTGIAVGELRRAAPPLTPPQKEKPVFQANSNAPLNPDYDKPDVDPSQVKSYAMTVDTGDVLVQWPARLSQEDYDTASAWLEGMKKKMKRAVAKDDSQD